MSEKFKKFIEAYESFAQSEVASRAILSENAGDRDGARAFALASAAKTIPGFETIAADPIAAAEVLKSDASVDKLLGNAMKHFKGLSEQMYAAGREEIIANTPNEGLAAIVLGLPPLKVKGDKKLEEIAGAHKAYQELAGALPGKDEQPDHRKLYSALASGIEKKIKAVISGDEHLKKVKGLDKATLETAKFVLAGSATSCLSVALSLANGYKKEFEKYLPDEETRAKYARDILANMKDAKEIPNAMAAVYGAYDAAEKAKKAKKK